MITGFLKTILDRTTGRGGSAVTIPAMDGALQPNTRLEDSERIVEIAAPDNLAEAKGAIYFSSGRHLFIFNPASPAEDPYLSFETPISALAVAADGTVAVGLNGRIVFAKGPTERAPIVQLGNMPLNCPTALAFVDAETLIVCVGSNRYSPDDWQRSLMNQDFSGSVWKVTLSAGKAERIADKLAYPYGILVGARDEGIVVSESWRHRLIRLTAKGKPEIVLENLPGYPARLSRSPDGGSWLAVASPRSQLIEFVLREPAFRTRMMREIDDPNMWVAPALHSRRNFLEPMQGGALKQMGILKPWAPTRSYGLAIKLDRDFLPVESLHSRTDGVHHGIRSCLEADGHLIAASGGGNAILKTRL